MGFTNGKWVTTTAPNQIDYPFTIAAKLARDARSCSHEEVCDLITTTRYFYDLCREQDVTIRRLTQELAVAENTVRLLQVNEP